MCIERTSRPVVVGAAIMAGGRLLACARAHPPALAGYWELPGGKVKPGESETVALVRECREELGVPVMIGARVGADTPITGGVGVLRVYLANLADGTRPQPLEHADLRWLSEAELYGVPWLPADLPVLAALHPYLGT